MLNWLKKIINKPSKVHNQTLDLAQFCYLQNPYFQLNCWLQYRTADPIVAEKALKLLLELKELCLKFDEINKQRFKESFDNRHPYNIMMDVVVSEKLNRYIDRMKEEILIRKNTPENFVNFRIGFYSFTRLIRELELEFDPAFPNEEARQQFDELCKIISSYDRFFATSEPSEGGEKLRTFHCI